MHFFTSININYLPKARVLAKSIKENCKNARFSLVISDKWPENLDRNLEDFDDIITLNELGIPVSNLPFWIYEHTVVELCTAVKGQALLNFLTEGSEKVIYLDPDIIVYEELNELELLLDSHDIILTPHQTIPEKNRDDIINNEICSLQHGVYNFGFFAIRNNDNGLKFARWWRDRLTNFCFDDIPNGIFTDQKWGDLIPALFDGVHILKDPGYNVSTWNLSNRQITQDADGKIFVNGYSLKFYHFSGFDSGALNTMLNVYGKNNEILFKMKNMYIDAQNKAGQREFGKCPSLYNFYDNGVLIEKRERFLLRTRGDLNEYFKNSNPYVAEQEISYYLWYRAEGVNEIENKLEVIYKSRSWKFAQFLSKLYARFMRIK